MQSQNLYANPVRALGHVTAAAALPPVLPNGLLCGSLSHASHTLTAPFRLACAAMQVTSLQVLNVDGSPVSPPEVVV